MTTNEEIIHKIKEYRINSGKTQKRFGESSRKNIIINI